MKISALRKLIHECHQEVLQELDDDSSGVIKISKNDPQKQQKIQSAKQNQQSYEIYDGNSLEEMETDFANDEELAEMARIPILYALQNNWEEALERNEKLKNSPTIKGIVEYLKEKPEGASIFDIAQNAFEKPKRQQQLNPLFPALVDVGLLVNKGLRNEPKKHASKEKEKTVDSETGEELFGGGEEENPEDMFVGFGHDYAHEQSPNDEEEETPEETPVSSHANEPVEEPITPEKEDEFEDDIAQANDELELKKLVAQKDELVGKLKKGEISKDEYRQQIGDIPNRIKDLRKKLEDDGVDEAFYLQEGKRRLMTLAGIKK